ncbi:sodium:calcium antiporter [Acidimangrovimonas sediminis]|uniref:sodium:calcium antiporter n=1 Tax=Acidimangrovimonas sediminis TaxID=2056283 RepID=UPI000C80A882|nr:cation transporter [Acidimangrovimonas sediminis]
MQPLVLPWLELGLCGAVIAIAGSVLVRHGEMLAQLTGLSRSWIGLILLATATSLPELFTGVSAVTLADVPNLAVGDALGSCVFNLLLLVLLDELSRSEPMYRRVDQGHVLTAGFGVIMIGAVGALILLSREQLDLRLFHISAYTPLIIVVYLVAMRAAFDYERRSRGPVAQPRAEERPTVRTAVLRYLTAAVFVVAAGTWLPFIGRDIADAMGWRPTFVGTLLVAGATSLPELAVTISALRIGAVDMAIGNLLGSNLFDILIIALDDVAYAKGPLLSAVSPAHAITAFAAVIMSGIFIVAMLFKPKTRLRGTVGWVSLAMLVVYLFTSYAVYLHDL